jgi:hypothetical protein
MGGEDKYLTFEGDFMKRILTQPRALLFVACILLALFWLSLESEVFARAGGGKSSGSRGYSGHYVRTCRDDTSDHSSVTKETLSHGKESDPQ